MFMDAESSAAVDHLYRALASGYNPALRTFVPISKAELRQGVAKLEHHISPHGSRLVDLMVLGFLGAIAQTVNHNSGWGAKGGWFLLLFVFFIRLPSRQLN